MADYYNEMDEFAAQWLRNLIRDQVIPDGEVDERSIEDVRPSDLGGFVQCHFFAGIGVWAAALRDAGWPADRRVWTGSCPCQPFSTAGKGEGFADERHLWPAWYHLVEQCQPPDIFGEQVASKDAAPWLDLVQTDMEALGYAFGAVPFPAASVGAPHIRDRLFWVAHQSGVRLEGCGGEIARGLSKGVRQVGRDRSGSCGVVGWVADTDGCNQHSQRKSKVRQTDFRAESGRVQPRTTGCSELGGVVDTSGRRCDGIDAWLWAEDDGRVGSGEVLETAGSSENLRPSSTNGHWRDADWIFCRDGKWRPVEPGTFPLAHGLARSMGTLGAGLEGLVRVAGLDAESLKRAKSFRVGSLRGYGNAIVKPAAEEFVRAYLKAMP